MRPPIVLMVTGLLCTAHLCGTEPGNIRLNDLWEET
jgi:hypothetical protein